MFLFLLRKNFIDDTSIVCYFIAMKELRKGLSLINIFSIATGAMISSGLFVLPGLAYAKAGPAVIISYFLAGVLCIPTLLSKAELTTAMPKAGGDYFYIMRGFGPLLGTIAGLCSWFSLSLKSAFALIGMGAYVALFLDLPPQIIAIVFCLFFVFLNLIGVKEAGSIQVLLVFGLLTILVFYFLIGVRKFNPLNFSPFCPYGFTSIFATASFVFISYGGLTKVAALAEETRNPGKVLPLGMIISLLVTAILYTLVIFVTVAVMEPAHLKVSLTPISDGAGIIAGDIFKFIVSIGAILAFISTANSGIMSASRYPLSMGRDKLLPPVFRNISSCFKTPYFAILFTGTFIISAILFLKLELLVKVASSILILLYIFANLTLILFRESKIASYRPKFYSPFYPYLQIIGILGGIFLLIEMGTFVVFLTTIFLLLGYIWYKIYAQKKASQDTALIYLLERLVAKDRGLASDNLLTELKDIVLQREAMIKDRFHKLIEESKVLDIDEPMRMEDFFLRVADILSQELTLSSQELFDKFIERERMSTTVLRKGLAIPHIVVEGKTIFKILMARAKAGIIFANDEVVHIIFVLVGSVDERNLHLKVLAAIAQIMQDPKFDQRWLQARNEDELKNIVLLAERRRL